VFLYEGGRTEYSVTLIRTNSQNYMALNIFCAYKLQTNGHVTQSHSHTLPDDFLDLFEINLKTSIRLYPISITFHK